MSTLRTRWKKCIEKEAPMKIIQPKKGNKNWLTQDTRKLIKDRDSAREKARITKGD